MKRLTLDLGGKSPTHPGRRRSLHGDPMAINACYLNNGQRLHCGLASDRAGKTARRSEAIAKAPSKKSKRAIEDKDVTLGPLASTKQYKRVQEYIKSGIEKVRSSSSAGKVIPRDLKVGICVKPTVFANVTREMRIAKEEIFGPVLSILTYKTEAEAI